MSVFSQAGAAEDVNAGAGVMQREGFVRREAQEKIKTPRWGDIITMDGQSGR
jgi:hypothetical protein